MIRDFPKGPALHWDDIRELHAVKKLAQIVNRRWNLGIGFASADAEQLQIPQQNQHATVRALCQLVQSVGPGATCCASTAADAARRLRDPAAHTAEYVCHA